MDVRLTASILLVINFLAALSWSSMGYQTFSLIWLFMTSLVLITVVNSKGE
jgi:hypothetical protein